MTFKTTDLSDENAGKVQIVSPGLHNFGGKSRFYGQIATVKSLNDNSKVREKLWSDGRGKVLVIDNEGSLVCAMLGDMMAAKAIENGWAGVVINGCIRDSVDVAAMDIGIRAIATNPLRSLKEGRGEVDIDLQFLGANFTPGEYLYSDEDGILLSANPLL